MNSIDEEYDPKKNFLKLYLHIHNPLLQDKPYYKLDLSKDILYLHKQMGVTELESDGIFEFDKIFTNEKDNNLNIYNIVIEDIIKESLNGKSHCFISYGSTLSDKFKVFIGDIENKGILLQALDDIKNNDFNNNIEKLHEISMKKGGFINMENRRKIYKYILNNLKNENNDLNNNNNILIENKNYDSTVDADCQRSILHKIVNNNFSIKNYDKNKIKISNIDINNYLNELKKFIKESLENYKNFDYYQGYNEICLYFFILFGYNEVYII